MSKKIIILLCFLASMCLVAEQTKAIVTGDGITTNEHDGDLILVHVVGGHNHIGDGLI